MAKAKRELKGGGKVRLSVTIDAETLRRAEKAAKREARSLSNMVGVLLERGMLATDVSLAGARP